MVHGSRLLLWSLYTSLLLATSCGPHPSQPTSSSIPSTIENASADHGAIAAAYAERLRIGLGSPYRLIEIVLRDERLGDERGAVARGLLAQIEHGELYAVGPRVLVAAGLREPNAIAQFQLIEKAIGSTPDPRIGELAVNLAYDRAVSEHIVTPELAARVARVGALLRDRRLALRDAQRLRARARRMAVAPENLVLTWRRERAFAVEQPTLVVMDATAEQEAQRLAMLLIGGVRSASAPVAGTPHRTVEPEAAGLDVGAATALINDSISHSPQNALVITLRAIRTAANDTRARITAPHWQRLLEHGTDEESFVAELALARRGPEDEIVAASVALDAAIALRAFGQEQVARKEVASPQTLSRRFGVRVRFHSNVTAAAREQSLVMLESALLDLRSAVRTIDLTGLTFEIGPIRAGAPHLAFHDPRKRVIRLDPATMAGTIAHEVGHDLDWQLAARKYKARAHYATDYAAKHGRAFAYVVESLTAPAANMRPAAQEDPGARRPAEIFARRFEWYIAAVLAQAGRSNGYLSSVQSDWIAGYGSAARPDPSRVAAKSFAAILGEAAALNRAEVVAAERVVTETAPFGMGGPRCNDLRRIDPISQLIASHCAELPSSAFRL